MIQTKRKLKSLFPLELFDALVVRFTAAGISGEQTRQIRKEGLALVRDTRNRLSDPRIRQLTKIPFDGVPRFDGHFGLGQALLNIEKTVLLTDSKK